MEPLDGAATVFISIRPRLFGIAYRILRNPVEAEDIVQDAWLRWQATDRASILNPEAFLVTTTTRLALNYAQSARRRREVPAGPWLPQVRDEARGPEPDAERAEEVEEAMLLLLAKLTPAERAAYVLREAFDYPYGRIADLLRLGVANCRQIVRRARLGLASDRRRPVSVTAHKRLVDAFLTAAQGGDFADLEHVLITAAASPGAVTVGSGGYDMAAV